MPTKPKQFNIRSLHGGYIDAHVASLQDVLGISKSCAEAVAILRTKHTWTKQQENELISSFKLKERN